MVATAAVAKLTSRMSVRTVIWQPADGATAQLVDLGQPQGASQLCLPIENYRDFLVQITASLLVGNGVSAFSIYAATSAAGANGTAVVTHAVGSAPDAEGDSLHLECDIEQIREVLPAATHIGVWVDEANNDDEAAVVVIRAGAVFESRALTSDYVAA